LLKALHILMCKFLLQTAHGINLQVAVWPMLKQLVVVGQVGQVLEQALHGRVEAAEVVEID
jgi:hypothetical protein